jgi:hypothetical protein
MIAPKFSTPGEFIALAQICVAIRMIRRRIIQSIDD